MLNIKELEKQFDEILHSFSDKDLEEWLAFAELREQFAMLNKGHTVTLNFNNYQIADIENSSAQSAAYEKNIGDYNYALAA